MTVIQNALKRAANAGVANDQSKESVAWFRKNLRKTAINPSRLIREERENLIGNWRNLGIGKMYQFFYDPKWKNELPYYDQFPLMIPIHFYEDGPLGINLHYLPPVLRAKLFDELLAVQNNPKYDDRKRMVISYGILKGASKFAPFKPCLKRYLGKHFRSRFLRIPHEQWVVAAFLPTETFIKATKDTVWSDSRKMLK